MRRARSRRLGLTARQPIDRAVVEEEEVLAQLVLAQRAEPFATGLDLLDAAAEENDERRIVGVAVVQLVGHRGLAAVQEVSDVLPRIRMVLHVVLQVARAEVEMPAGFVGEAAEDVAVDRERQDFGEALEGHDLVRLVDDVDRHQQFGHLQGAEPGPVHCAEARLTDAAAVRERALAQDLDLAAGIERLGREEVLHVVEAVGDLLFPGAEELVLREAVLCVDRAHLAEGTLHVVGLRLEVTPVDVGRWRPMLANSVLVERVDAVGPDFALLVDRVRAGHVGAGRRVRAERGVVLVGPAVGNVAVGADVDLRHAEAVRAGHGLDPELRAWARPAQVQLAVRRFRVVLDELQVARGALLCETKREEAANLVVRLRVDASRRPTNSSDQAASRVRMRVPSVSFIIRRPERPSCPPPCARGGRRGR